MGICPTQGRNELGLGYIVAKNGISLIIGIGDMDSSSPSLFEVDITTLC